MNGNTDKTIIDNTDSINIIEKNPIDDIDKSNIIDVKKQELLPEIQHINWSDYPEDDVIYNDNSHNTKEEQKNYCESDESENDIIIQTDVVKNTDTAKPETGYKEVSLHYKAKNYFKSLVIKTAFGVEFGAKSIIRYSTISQNELNNLFDSWVGERTTTVLPHVISNSKFKPVVNERLIVELAKIPKPIDVDDCISVIWRTIVEYSMDHTRPGQLIKNLFTGEALLDHFGNPMLRSNFNMPCGIEVFISARKCVQTNNIIFTDYYLYLNGILYPMIFTKGHPNDNLQAKANRSFTSKNYVYYSFQGWVDAVADHSINRKAESHKPISSHQHQASSQQHQASSQQHQASSQQQQATPHQASSQQHQASSHQASFHRQYSSQQQVTPQQATSSPINNLMASMQQQSFYEKLRMEFSTLDLEEQNLRLQLSLLAQKKQRILELMLQFNSMTQLPK